MTKKDLLENISDYSSNEIAAAIQQGTVTFYELKTLTHGQFTPLLQRSVKKLLDSGEVSTPNVEKPKPQEPVVQQMVITTNTVPQAEPVQQDEPQIVIPTSETKVVQETKPFSPVTNPVPSTETTPLHFGPTVQQTTQQTTSQQTVQHPLEMEINQDEAFYCPHCGNKVPSSALECPHCGRPFHEETNPPYQEVNDPFAQQVITPSGEPSNINKFNWGAFLLHWIWGVGNGVYWSLVILVLNIASSVFISVGLDTLASIISLVSISVAIILGFNGNRQAWKSGRFKDPEEFVKIQRKWTKGALIFWGVFVLLIISIAILVSL